jgi:hypothetical protein
MRFLNSVYFKIICALLILLVSYNVIVVKHNKDFDVFIQASKALWTHQPMYEVWFHSGDSGLKYFYSPLFAALLLPLSQAPQWLYNLFWYALNLFFIYRIFSLFRFFLPLEKLSESGRALFYFLCFVCSARYIIDNLELGQMTFLLVWGSMESFRLFLKGKFLWAAALLALIINIKLIPIALLGYFIYRAEWKMAGLTILFLGLYFILPALAGGWDYNIQMHESWFSSLTTTTSQAIYEDDGRPCISAWIPALTMEIENPPEIKRNFVNLDAATVNALVNGTRLIIAALLAFLFSRPLRNEKIPLKVFYDLSLLCLVTPLFFPHQGRYAVFYLILPYAFCIYQILTFRNNAVKILLVISFALVTLTTDGLIGTRGRDIADYLNLITYGAFALLAAMILFRKRSHSQAS